MSFLYTAYVEQESKGPICEPKGAGVRLGLPPEPGGKAINGSVALARRATKSPVKRKRGVDGCTCISQLADFAPRWYCDVLI